MRQLMTKIKQPDVIFQIVYVGQDESVLPCHQFEIDPEKVLRVGNIDEFEWELDTDYGLEEDLIWNETMTDRLISYVNGYMSRRQNGPLISELYEELLGPKGLKANFGPTADTVRME